MSNARILLIDNEDSFTFNLVELLRVAGAKHSLVLPTNKVQKHHIQQCDKIIFSPGPGHPKEHPYCRELLKEYQTKKSFLGVCLGHQIIGLYYGARLEQLSQPRHGVQEKAHLTVKESRLFRGLPPQFSVGLYHSWQLNANLLPPSLEITAINGTTLDILAIQHTQYDISGVQFHPESFLCPLGKDIMQNFLR